MKRRVPLRGGFVGAALFLSSCSSAPKILPKNEINEPTFHTTHFAGLGTGLGQVKSRPMGSDDYADGLYVEPTFLFHRKVGTWASFSLWPLFWNFLLTGEQYADSSHLKTGMLGMAFHGGVSGLAYSQRDGFVMSGLLALSGKYLFDSRWFADTHLGLSFYDLKEMPNSISRAAFGVGRQLNARNSLKATYSLAYFAIPEGFSHNDRTLLYHRGDYRTEVILRHSYYAWSKHIFGPEAGFSLKNHDTASGHYLKFGLHYRFIFD